MTLQRLWVKLWNYTVGVGTENGMKIHHQNPIGLTNNLNIALVGNTESEAKLPVILDIKGI